MKPYLIAVAAVFGFFIAAILTGATNNVQPILSGSGTGKVIFPENAIPAIISASGGAPTIAAGGSNQNVVLVPSGTGSVVIPVTASGATFPQIVLNAGTTALGRISALNPNGRVDLLSNLSYDGTNFNLDDITQPGEVLSILGGFPSLLRVASAGTNPRTLTDLMTVDQANLRLGVNQPSPAYILDVGGDINTNTVYRKGGTAGISTTITPGSTVTTLGGIVTASTAGGTPTSSSGTISGTNNAWRVVVLSAITTFTVTEGSSYTPNSCVANSSATIVVGSSLSGSTVTIFAGSSLAGVTINGLCQ